MKFFFLTVFASCIGLHANSPIKMPFDKGVENGKDYVQPIRKAIDEKEEQAKQKEGALSGANGRPMQSFDTPALEIHGNHGEKE